jgi:ubiquinone/menaquinone biosynthesis C-methylase UbiE
MDCAVTHPYHSGNFGGSDDEPLRPGGLELTRLAVQHAGFAEGDRILDLGCGEGAGTQLLCLHGCNAIGLDTSIAALAAAAEHMPGLQLISASALSLPFADESLDGILAECSLSLVEQRAVVLAESHRVLRSGGRLAITDVYARNTVSHDQPLPACLAGMTAQNEILAELANAGFRVERWEDHSQVLKEFMARLIFESDTPDALWAGDAATLNAALRQSRPGYFLLIAVKD